MHCLDIESPSIVFVYAFLIFVSVVSIILLIVMQFEGKSRKVEHMTKFSGTKSIPKVIWTYWASTEVPDSVQLCIDTWKFYNPHYDVIMLNRDNVSDYVDIDIYAVRNVENDVRASDILRLYLLQKHGGVWMDSTIICTKPLDWLLEEDGNEFIGFFMGSFTTRDRFPVIENWFMACPSESNLIFLVWNEFMRIGDFNSIDDYVKDVRNSGIDFQNIPYPEYLAMHIAFQKVLQTSDPFAMRISDARGVDGPFRYLDENQWESQKALDQLCKDELLKTPLIKLRGAERDLVEEGKSSIECFRVVEE